jgi:hypothetical protein
MRYTPRQIVVRAREAAYLLLAMLDHDAMVKRFLEGYAKENNRTGVITQPALFRDLMGSVRREAILAMATHMDELAPRRLGIAPQPAMVALDADSRTKAAAKGTSRGAKATARGAKSKPIARGKGRSSTSAMAVRERTAEMQMLNLFREQFFAALGQALRWTDEEFGEFLRDSDLYQAIAARGGSAGPARGPKTAAAGAFVDRCGLLVDPSMLEQARRAAAKFQAQLDTAADGILKKVFARRREN